MKYTRMSDEGMKIINERMIYENVSESMKIINERMIYENVRRRYEDY